MSKVTHMWIQTCTLFIFFSLLQISFFLQLNRIWSVTVHVKYEEIVTVAQKYKTSWDLQSQMSVSKIPFHVTHSTAPCCISLNAVILHIFSHTEGIMLPLYVCCVSPVSWAQIRWGGLGWAGPWLWIMAQDGCRNDWEEPQPPECGRVCVCVTIQHGYRSARDLL